MKNQTPFPWARWLFPVIALTLVPTITLASAYKFEMILFERPGGGSGEFWPLEPGTPDPAQAIGRLGSSGGSGGVNMLPAASKTLGPAAYTLKKKGMIVHRHLAWTQPTRGRNSNSWYWVDSGRLSGLIRLSRGRYLHLDTDLVLRDAASAQPYRIKLHRRMRSDELHYVDHPRLGILIRAKRLQTTAPTSGPDATSTGEPKPAAPPTAGQPG